MGMLKAEIIYNEKEIATHEKQKKDAIERLADLQICQLSLKEKIEEISSNVETIKLEHSKRMKYFDTLQVTSSYPDVSKGADFGLKYRDLSSLSALTN